MVLHRIEQIGGPFDGQHFDSSEDSENGRAAGLLYALSGARREEAKRQEHVGSLDQIIRRGSPAMIERAEAEGWSEAKRKALMQFYDYGVEGWTEDEEEVLIQARFERMER